MENVPQTPEDKSDDSEDSSSGKKKKRAAGLGAFIVEPKEPVEAEKREGFWQKLTGTEEKSKDETVDKASPEADTTPELPLAELSSEEALFVEQAIAKTNHEASQESPVALTDVGALAAEQAVEQFRNRIINENKDSEQALEETLAEIVPIAEADVDVEALKETTTEPQLLPEESISLHHQESTRTDDDRTSPTTVNNAGLKSALNNNEYVPDFRESNPAGAALLGGIIGYLIGRRRGRITTEKKLQPVQKKLEVQVNQLHHQIAEKEAVIRRVVLGQTPRPTKANLEKHPDDLLTRPEVNRYSEPLLQPERIGKVIVEAEATPITSPERLASKREIVPQLKDREIETLNRAELLAISEKIVVEGTTLRRIYETSLVGERGLRRLVAEHLKGGDIKRVLKRELVEREIDFERDPILRDRAQSGGQSGGGTATLNSLLEQAGAQSAHDSQQAALLKSRAAYEAKVKQKQTHRRRIADTMMVGTITLLIAIVLLLLFTR